MAHNKQICRLRLINLLGVLSVEISPGDAGRCQSGLTNKSGHYKPSEAGASPWLEKHGKGIPADAQGICAACSTNKVRSSLEEAA